MPELRWTLLILGALFIGGPGTLGMAPAAACARAPDGATGAFTGSGAGGRESERLSPTFEGGRKSASPSRAAKPARGRAFSTAARGARRDGERISPTFDDTHHASFTMTAPPAWRPARGVFREPTLTFPEVSVEMPADTRDRFADPPVVELDDESLDRLKVEAGEAVDEFSEPREEGEAVDDFSEDLDDAPAPVAADGLRVVGGRSRADAGTGWHFPPTGGWCPRPT